MLLILTSAILLPACAAARVNGFVDVALQPSLSANTSTAQESHAQKRSEEILASFNKRKHEAKEAFGVRKERYKEIRSEPVVRRDLGSYAGMYEVPGLGYRIQISASDGGKVEANGYEPQGGGTEVSRRFHLEDLRLEGALLTGTKVYEDGARERFEGLFINMTDMEGVSPTQIEHRATTFGLGVVGVRVENGGVTSDKIFYQFKQ